MKVDAGEPIKKGSGYVRKDVISVSGELFVTDNAATVKYLNGAFVKAGRKAVFTEGQSLGTLTSSFSVTVTCSLTKDCKGCAFWKVQDKPECGHCDILTGITEGTGHCDSWSARPVG